MSDQLTVITDKAAAIPLQAVLQYEEIQQSGETNMLDINRVQQIANARDMHELVILCENHDKYMNLLANYSELLAAAQAEQARQQAAAEAIPEPPIAEDDTQDFVPVTAPVDDGLPDLHLHAERLHRQRKAVIDLKAIYDDALADFKEENRILIEALADAKTELAQVEDQAREAALTHFDVTGQKSLGFGFSVAERTIHHVEDDDAIAYCIAHNLPGVLKLNNRAFMKLLNTGVISPDDLAFETVKESQVRIASDLLQHLPVASE